MRDFRILIGSEGPMDNVLKIRPPLSIEIGDIDMIIDTLDIILEEASLLIKLPRLNNQIC